MAIRITDNNELNFTASAVINHISEQLNSSECYPFSEEKKLGKHFVNSIHDGMRALWLRGEKIKAIKMMRTIFPVGLADAKNYLESMYNN